jgi:hypothetical protein
MAASIGRDVRCYCIFDSDFHTPNQIANRLTEAGEKGVSLHVWQRKELENYLLVPEAIFRAVGSRARQIEPSLNVETIRCKLFELAGDLRNDVLDGYANEFLMENRSAGLTPANRMARERVANWENHDERLSLASGKIVLARLSSWLQETYGVAISSTRIARVMRRSEIADEIIDVLSAIEAGQPFERLGGVSGDDSGVLVRSAHRR